MLAYSGKGHFVVTDIDLSEPWWSITARCYARRAADGNPGPEPERDLPGCGGRGPTAAGRDEPPHQRGGCAGWRPGQVTLATGSNRLTAARAGGKPCRSDAGARRIRLAGGPGYGPWHGRRRPSPACLTRSTRPGSRTRSRLGRRARHHPRASGRHLGAKQGREAARWCGWCSRHFPERRARGGRSRAGLPGTLKRLTGGVLVVDDERVHPATEQPRCWSAMGTRVLRGGERRGGPGRSTNPPRRHRLRACST